MHAKSVFDLSACVVYVSQQVLSFELSERPCTVVPAVTSTFALALLTQVLLVGLSSWLVSSTSQFVGTMFAVGFALGVGRVIGFNPCSGGSRGWLQGGSGPELWGTRSDETFGVPWIST